MLSPGRNIKYMLPEVSDCMRDFSKVKRIVLKIGSSSIVNEDLSINQNMIYSLMKAFYQFKQKTVF